LLIQHQRSLPLRSLTRRLDYSPSCLDDRANRFIRILFLFASAFVAHRQLLGSKLPGLIDASKHMLG
jgi:hypothetical protein